MIYSDAFAALPPPARGAIYQRMWRILSQPTSEHRAIAEILRDTKTDLPPYFR